MCTIYKWLTHLTWSTKFQQIRSNKEPLDGLFITSEHLMDKKSITVTFLLFCTQTQCTDSHHSAAGFKKCSRVQLWALNQTKNTVGAWTNSQGTQNQKKKKTINKQDNRNNKTFCWPSLKSSGFNSCTQRRSERGC